MTNTHRSTSNIYTSRQPRKASLGRLTGRLLLASTMGSLAVLRDVAAAGFRQVNTASKLGQIFSDLQSQNMDLSAVAVMEPKLNPKPKLDKKNNTLRITGVFPGKPVGIGFDLIYQVVGGKWRLFGISVNPVKSK